MDQQTVTQLGVTNGLDDMDIPMSETDIEGMLKATFRIGAKVILGQYELEHRKNQETGSSQFWLGIHSENLNALTAFMDKVLSQPKEQSLPDQVNLVKATETAESKLKPEMVSADSSIQPSQENLEREQNVKPSQEHYISKFGLFVTDIHTPNESISRAMKAEGRGLVFVLCEALMFAHKFELRLPFDDAYQVYLDHDSKLPKVTPLMFLALLTAAFGEHPYCPIKDFQLQQEIDHEAPDGSKYGVPFHYTLVFIPKSVDRRFRFPKEELDTNAPADSFAGPPNVDASMNRGAHEVPIADQAIHQNNTSQPLSNEAGAPDHVNSTDASTTSDHNLEMLMQLGDIIREAERANTWLDIHEIASLANSKELTFNGTEVDYFELNQTFKCSFKAKSTIIAGTYQYEKHPNANQYCLSVIGANLDFRPVDDPSIDESGLSGPKMKTPEETSGGLHE